MDAWIACPTCGGNGGRECGVCLGDGGFEVRPALNPAVGDCAKSYIHTAPMSCPSCFGFGEMGACPQCHGAGVLLDTDCAAIHTPSAIVSVSIFTNYFTCGGCSGWGESAEWGGSCPTCNGTMLDYNYLPWDCFPACRPPDSAPCCRPRVYGRAELAAVLRAELPRWVCGDARLERQLGVLLFWGASAMPKTWDLLLALGLVAMRPWTAEEKKALKASMQERGYTHCPRIDAMKEIARKIAPELLRLAEDMCESVAWRLRLDLGNLLRLRSKLSARTFWDADWHDLCRRREDLACVLRIVQLGQGRAWFPPSLAALDSEAEAVDQDGIEVNKKQREARERVALGWWGL